MPISQMCIAIKIMECIIRDSMLNYLNTNMLLFQQQYGFRATHSILTALLFSCQQIACWTEYLADVNSIYSDLTKAFGSAGHLLLILKLRAYGFNGLLFPGYKTREVVEHRLSNLITLFRLQFLFYLV